jgi:site-specific DNA recombinase
MFEMRLKGAGYAAIRSALFEAGFRPRGGGVCFNHSTLRQMFRNPAYAGMIRVDGELVAASHEAIVSVDQWRAVNELRRELTVGAQHRTALLSGFVVCAGCGNRMKYERRRGKPNVYRCNTRSLSTQCPRGSSITGDALDAYVVEAMLLSRARFKRQRTKVAAHVAEVRARHVARLGEIQRTIDQLTARLGAADPSACRRVRAAGPPACAGARLDSRSHGRTRDRRSERRRFPLRG